MDSKEQMISLISSALEQLDSTSKSPEAFVGFDGYIDKIQHPVKQQSKDKQVFYPTLDEFGEKIQAASNQSAQIELSTQETKIGGNGPIMAHALANLGIKTHCIGTFGLPEINEVFKEIHRDCKLYSVGQSAETNALEFNDGKLILSELSTFNELIWDSVKHHLGGKLIKRLISQSDLIALVDWCNLPFATGLWKGILDEYTADIQGKKILFDLTDPSKKSKEEVIEVLKLISSFSETGEVTFGLNENEAKKIHAIISEKHESDLAEIGRAIFDFMSVTNIVIHPINGCYYVDKQGVEWVPGRVEPSPKVSTGGGDNFNAGLFYGLLNDFAPLSSVALAIATSGAYVKNGRSPDTEALKSYLNQWLSEIRQIN